MGHDGHDEHEHHHHGHHHHEHHAHRHEPNSVPDGHKHTAPAQVGAFVITCSDSRTTESDESGKLLRSELEKAGHTLIGSQLVKDDAEALKAAIAHGLEHGARAILITGGTGISSRDVSVEVVEHLVQKRLDGFGELFRMLSYEEIGSAAMMSRAVAGTYHGALLFALPGSPNACRLAMARLILPELGHAVRELMR